MPDFASDNQKSSNLYTGCAEPGWMRVNNHKQRHIVGFTVHKHLKDTRFIHKLCTCLSEPYLNGKWGDNMTRSSQFHIYTPPTTTTYKVYY